MNYYDILGLKRGASKREITDAYRKRAKEYHPDTNRHDPNAEQKFKALHDAYINLLNFTDRPHTSHNAINPSPTRRNSVKEITLTIYEAINGVHYKIDDANGRCDTCLGAGYVRLKVPSSCPYCGGTGNSAYKNRGPLSINVVCAHCDGSGRTMRRNCFECHGFGTKAGAGLIIDLPAGCLAGDSFTIENGFSNTENNVKGDLELLIALKPDPRFRVLGKDIEMQVMIDVWEAVLGVSKKNIVGPCGDNHTFSIPSGTMHGQRIRIKNMGMRKMTDDLDKGDLILIVSIMIPNGDDPKIKEAYRRLRDELIT